MVSQRIERVQKQLRAEISTVFQRKIKDPRINMVTVTEVDVSPDLKNAHVWVSVIGGPEAETEALAGLRSAAGFIRSQLMEVLHLRPMPVLEFDLDTSLDRGSHTLDLLDQIRHEHNESDPVS